MDMGNETPHSIIAAAFAQLEEGGSVSLDSVARAVGLTKPGVMYHYPTKEALMLALVDSVLDRWESELTARLGATSSQAGPHERIRAYLDWSPSGEFSETDLVAMSDPKLRRTLTHRWTERLAPWLTLPTDLAPDVRARLIAARLLADGGWLADATNFFPPTPDERARVHLLAHNLIKD